MTLRELTDLMSCVGRTESGAALMKDRSVALFVQACIEEAKKQPTEAAPLAPVDFCQH